MTRGNMGLEDIGVLPKSKEFTLAQGKQANLNIDGARVRAVGVTNLTPFWVHFPDNPSAWAWVPPSTFGAVVPVPAMDSVRVNSIDTPSFYPTPPSGSTQTVQLTAFEAPLPASPGLPFSLQSQILVKHIAALTLSTLSTGFNSIGTAFSDTYVLGWYWSITGAAGAGTSCGPAIKGVQSGTEVILGKMNVAASGQAQILYPSNFPLRLIDLLPTDTTFNVGIDSDTTIASITRGSVFLGA